MSLWTRTKQRVKRFFATEARPLATYVPWTLPTTSEAYEGLNKYYREYRRDALVRACTNILAYYATNRGFETQIAPAGPEELSKEKAEELRKEHADLKAKVDTVNKAVNLDWVLYVAIIKCKIYGRAGFEIVRDENDEIVMLLPLLSESLEPKVGENWELQGFNYKGKTDFYEPKQVLYFINNQLEADYQGLSEIEPILDTVERRRNLQEAIKEASKLLWAPLADHELDTSGLTDQEAQKALEDYKAAIKPGKHLVHNTRAKVAVIDLKPNIDFLSKALEDANEEIIGYFRVPKILLAREMSAYSRATLEAELNAFYEGPISQIQRYIRREVERQFYDLIVEEELGEDPPVRVKHIWNPISVTDFYEMANAVATLWGVHAMGPIGGNKRKVWELMQWDSRELELEKGGMKG